MHMITNILLTLLVIEQAVAVFQRIGIAVNTDLIGTTISANIAAIRKHTFGTYINTMHYECEK